MGLGNSSMISTEMVFFDECGRPTEIPIYYTSWAEYLNFGSFPLMFLISVVGNILTIFILRRLNSRSWSLSNVFLCALAISDLSGTFFDISGFIYRHQEMLGIDVDDMNIAIPLAYWTAAGTWGKHTCVYVSDWLLIYFTMERLYSVKFRSDNFHAPLQLAEVKSWTVFLFGGLVFLSLMLSAGSPVEELHYVFQFENYPGNRTNFEYHKPAWLQEWHSLKFYTVVIIPVLTALILAALNLCLIRIKQRRYSTSTLLPNEVNDLRLRRSVSAPANGRHATVTNNMLIGCVLMYFFTQLPSIAHNVLLFMSEYPNCLFKLNESYPAVVEHLVATIARINFTCNFLIYVAVNPKFWRLTTELLRKLLTGVSSAEPNQRRASRRTEWTRISAYSDFSPQNVIPEIHESKHVAGHRGS